MTTYIAFLRGINVGAHNRMKMEKLRTVFESLGYGAVETAYNTREVTVEDPDGYTLVFSEPVDTSRSFEDVMGEGFGE
jgi:uncharacterized protein (DUF1697 family)